MRELTGKTNVLAFRRRTTRGPGSSSAEASESDAVLRRRRAPLAALRRESRAVGLEAAAGSADRRVPVWGRIVFRAGTVSFR